MRRGHGAGGEAQAGWVLLELLLCCVMLGVLALAAVPAVRELYLEAAVEYETECLYTDIRQLQVLSRTTCYLNEGAERPVQRLRLPSLLLNKTYYQWRQGEDDLRRHTCLPGVYIALRGRTSPAGDVIVFTDDSWPSTRLMTIDVFAEGRRPEGRHILISNGRIRVERGKGS